MTTSNIQDFISAELAKDQFKTYDSLFWEFFNIPKKPGFTFAYNKEANYVMMVYHFRKVDGHKARGVGRLDTMTAERVNTVIAELEALEVAKLKSQIKVLETVAQKWNAKTPHKIESIKPVVNNPVTKKQVAPKSFKAMVKIAQDAQYMPVVLSETAEQLKARIEAVNEIVAYTVVSELVEAGNDVVTNFLKAYNKQLGAQRVKIGDKDVAFTDIDLTEFKVLSLDEWFAEIQSGS